MKQIKNKIIILILLLVLVAGITVTVLKGLNFSVVYAEAKRVDLYIDKEFNVREIKEIVKEVLGNQEILIQKIELYGDAVAVTAREITDEKKDQIIDKVNEKYGTEIEKEETAVTSVPKVRGRDIVKKYIKPFILSSIIIMAYLIIRYYKLGFIKVALETVGITILAQAELLSVMALTRIPIGRLTIPIILAVYVLTLLGISTYFENKLQQLKEDDDDEDEDDKEKEEVDNKKEEEKPKETTAKKSTEPKKATTKKKAASTKKTATTKKAATKKATTSKKATAKKKTTTSKNSTAKTTKKTNSKGKK